MERTRIVKEHSSGYVPGQADRRDTSEHRSSDCSHVTENPNTSSLVLIHRFLPAWNGRTLWGEMIAWAFGSGCFFAGTILLAGFCPKFFQEPDHTPRIILSYCLATLLGLVFSGLGIFLLRTLWKERVALAEWFRRGPRPAMPRQAKEGRFWLYAFCGMVASMIVAGLVQELTKNKTLSGRIVVTAAWLFFAAMNGEIFYTGRFRWKSGPTLTRKDSPWAFYTSAILAALWTMSIVTYMLWAVYTSPK